MASYCDYVLAEKSNPLHRAYHDTEYGFPLVDENQLFERLILEIFQAGLSWEGVLKKREGLRAAFANFNVEKVAAFGYDDVERIMADPSVIRNRQKINSTIHNARVLLDLREAHGSFAGWLSAQPAMDLAEWTKLFRATFKFMGPEIVREFLTSIGYLPGAHDETCPFYRKTIDAGAHWATAP